MNQRITMLAVLCITIVISGCKSEKAQTNNADKTASRNDEPKSSGATTSPSGGGHHGKPIQLGTAKIGAYDVKASRDAGALTPGGDAAIDVWLDGPFADVTAVRFWIGTRTDVESIKARAEIEDPKEPNHWHTHAELPDPMPAESQLWVEIETGEQTQTGAFNLEVRG